MMENKNDDEVQVIAKSYIEVKRLNDFKRDMTDLINRYSMEAGSNTPDFILAEHVVHSIREFNATTRLRDAWYGRTPLQSEPQVTL